MFLQNQCRLYSPDEASAFQGVGHFTPTERQEQFVEQNSRLRCAQSSVLRLQRPGQTGGLMLFTCGGTAWTLATGRHA